MLQNASLLAIVAVDTEENEPIKNEVWWVRRHFWGPRSYRRQGCGDAMLSFVERTAAAAGIEHLFALSTHTMQWFEERGFSETSLAALPPQRVAIYNHQRGQSGTYDTGMG